jgi:uncharacterized membrane protein
MTTKAVSFLPGLMNQRPRSITVISWIFIVFGGIALVTGLLPLPQRITELKQHPFEFGLVQAVRILGVLAGAYMLCGFNWARCLLVAWIAFHVILSAFHSLVQLTVHGLSAAVVGYFLFRAPAGAYFRGARAEQPETRATNDKPLA